MGSELAGKRLGFNTRVSFPTGEAARGLREGIELFKAAEALGMTKTDVLDPLRLRQVFGAFPSGVTAVAAVVDGVPVGMSASSFTSVSLEPALVSICLAHSSTTWALLRRAPRLGVSILSDEQERAGRQLGSRDGNRFASLDWRVTDDGAVLLNGASAWLDTSIEQQVRAGDHDIVVLAVHDLDADHDIRPLVFHASQFRRLEA